MFAKIFEHKRKTIKEEDNEQQQWYQDARKMTLKELPKFVKHLADDYDHDYGTICHAITAASIASAWALDRSSQGGITGFQAGVIMWMFMEKWNNVKFPARLLKYENALYPQYEQDFNSISLETWEWMQKEAKKLVDENQTACDEVKTHWQSIVDGNIPFGLKIRKEED
jgi:hypothetical protein